MIGVIGYGMVGKAVVAGFSKTHSIISDPAYNDVDVEHLCACNVDVIFVCLPTPTDDTEYSLIRGVLRRIQNARYKGLVVVKSTIPPEFLKPFDVVYNPEFLSRATSLNDFINPPLVLIGGPRAQHLVDLYRECSDVDMSRVFLTDIPTAAFIKYTMNSFYATKVTFMNQMHEVAAQMGADYQTATNVLASHPWMGTHHFQVPGPDGDRGFGGPCLPKDTQALVKYYDVEILKKVLEINNEYRSS